MVDVVDNATNLEKTPLHFFEKFDLKVEKFKKYLNELQRSPRLRSCKTLQPLLPSNTVQKLNILLQSKFFAMEIPVFGLSRFSAQNPTLSSESTFRHL